MFAALLLASALAGCHLVFPFAVDPPASSDDAARPRDSAWRADRGGGADLTSTDLGAPADAWVLDAPHQADLGAWYDGGAVTCTKSLDNCPAGLACQCCGSIGPKAICICSTACTGDADCARPSQPLCNKASAAATAGICTPPTFNCCWQCQ